MREKLINAPLRFIALTTTLVALNSAAFVGSYGIVPKLDANGNSVPNTNYQTMTAQCSSNVTGPSQPFRSTTDNHYDPQPGSDGNQPLKTALSTATFKWVPAGQNDQIPPPYKISHDYQVTGQLSASRNDPHAATSAHADVFPNLGAYYDVSAASSDPNQDQPPLDVNSTGNTTDFGWTTAPGIQFPVQVQLGAKASSLAWAMSGGTGNSSSSITIKTTKIELIAQPPTP